MNSFEKKRFGRDPFRWSIEQRDFVFQRHLADLPVDENLSMVMNIVKAKSRSSQRPEENLRSKNDRQMKFEENFENNTRVLNSNVLA